MDTLGAETLTDDAPPSTVASVRPGCCTGTSKSAARHTKKNVSVAPLCCLSSDLLFQNDLWHFQPHLPVLPALYHVEAPPADSLLRSLYERREEEEEAQEEKSQEAFGLERSFEVSVQPEE